MISPHSRLHSSFYQGPSRHVEGVLERQPNPTGNSSSNSRTILIDRVWKIWSSYLDSTPCVAPSLQLHTTIPNGWPILLKIRSLLHGKILQSDLHASF